MSGPKHCTTCGQSNSPDARFCGRCGAVMGASPPAPVAPIKRDRAASTMFAGSMDELPGAPGQPGAPPPHAGSSDPAAAAKTMFGASFDAPAPAAKDAARTIVDQPLVPPSTSKREPMRTMLGVAIDPTKLPASPFASSPGTLATPSPSNPPHGAVQSAFASHPPPPPQYPAAPFQPVQAPAPSAPTPASPSGFEPTTQMPATEANAVGSASPSQAWHEHSAPPPAAASPAPASPAPASPAPAAAPPPASPAPAGQAAAAATAARSNRTMLGMPAIDVEAIAAAAAAAREQAHHHRPKPTERGIPAAPKDAPPPEQAAQGKKRLGPSNRTMLGVAVQTGAAARGAGAQSAAEQVPAQQGHPPDAHAAPAPAYPNAYAHSPDVVDVSIAGLPSPARRGRGALMAVLVLGLLIVGAVAAVLLWYRFGRAPGLRVAVAQGEEGELLSIDVPDAPAGTRVRFGGQERELSAGHAELPLSVDALHVGDNPLSIDVLAPGGAAETRAVTLTVELRVRADLTTLAAEPAAITVVVEALPGSTATLDGAPLALDASGRATRAYPLDAIADAPPAAGQDPAAPLVHTVAYTVTPPGQAVASGNLTTRVPRTTLQIDRPGAEVVVEQDSIEIAGAVAPDAHVRIEGTDVPVSEGRFLHRFALPSVGDFSPSIVARAPGRAPTTRTLHIRRVEDLAREAASFEYDRTLTYARLATGPAHYQGQRVAFEGNVYNVDVQGGLTVLQMRARECPRGEQCLLWVTYASATDVTVGSWVRVLGLVGGEQQFRTESGTVRTVPRIDATYVLPARP